MKKMPLKIKIIFADVFIRGMCLRNPWNLLIETQISAEQKMNRTDLGELQALRL
jgi:hypothetical protein